MSFKTFIYYCAICGGWAGLVAWVLRTFILSGMLESGAFRQGVFGAVLGMLIAGIIGLLDAMLNASGFVRLIRVLICAGIGLVGGMIFGMIGEGIFEKIGTYTVGWVMVGSITGLSIGVWDIIRASGRPAYMGMAIKKVLRGVIGGAIGGLLGGFLQDLLAKVSFPTEEGAKSIKDYLEYSSVAIGFVIVGMCIGLLIGLAQVLLKEAWVRVERGFKAGREMMLQKPEITIGRAEGVDIPLFGDMGVEKKHARVIKKKDRWYLIDDNSPGGTFINGERIYGSAPLSNGDLIGMGRSEVRFQEKTK